MDFPDEIITWNYIYVRLLVVVTCLLAIFRTDSRLSHTQGSLDTKLSWRARALPYLHLLGDPGLYSIAISAELLQVLSLSQLAAVFYQSCL